MRPSACRLLVSSLLCAFLIVACSADWTDPDSGDNEYYWEEEERTPTEKIAVCGKGQPCSCDKAANMTLKCQGAGLESANLLVDRSQPPIEIANLKGNQLTYLFRGKILPGQEKSLLTLDLSANKIMDIEAGAFEPFTSLLRLKLTHNSLSELSSDIFTESLATLNQLYLDYNFLVELDDGLFDNLIGLTKLSLDGNSQLKINNKVLSPALSNLEVLSLDRCHLNNLDEDLFINLPNLRALSLSGNPLSSLPSAISPARLPSLSTLAMSDTAITVLKSNALKLAAPNLQKLYLRRMPSLVKIDKCAFCGLNQLKTLDISNSTALAEFDPAAFGTPPPTGLEQILLSGCALSGLDEQMLPTVYWETLEKLELAGNPWHCDCKLHWMMNSGKMMRVATRFNGPTCKTPENMQGLELFKASERLDCGPPQEGPSHVGKFTVFLVFMVLVASMVVFGVIYVRKRYLAAYGGDFRVPRFLGGGTGGTASNNQMGFAGMGGGGGRTIFGEDMEEEEDIEEEEQDRTGLEARVPSAVGRPRPEFV